MKLIPKYQGGTSNRGILDNTRVNYPYSSMFRPQLVKRKLSNEERRRLHDKNELIGPAQDIPEYLKEYYRRRGETLLWMEQRARNFESFGNLLNLTMPSTYVGQAIGKQLTGPEALAVDLVTAPVLSGIKTVGKKGVKAATKLATRGAEAYRRRFVYPREGLPQWFYTQKPLIARGTNLISPTPVNVLFERNRWNRLREPKYVTELDNRILLEHLPEYKTIQEKAMDEGNYLIVPKNFPLSRQLEDGRYIFTGDEGSWILSLSKDFKAKFGDKTLKVGYKGGTDQKAIEGGVQEHAPETFPEQDKGIFFAADKRYADRYNHGNRETPGFWLGFSKPYDMLEGGQRPFLLESEAIRYMRSIDAMPSFKGFPDKPFEILGNIWGDLSYLKDPKIMSIITKDPNKMTKAELIERTRLLSKIREGLNNDRVKLFGRMVDVNVKSGRWQPLRSTHYDGYIGRDHSLLWSPENDVMAPFGSHPESYVITKPEQASILVGNNGAFNGPAYSRKFGGKLKFRK